MDKELEHFRRVTGRPVRQDSFNCISRKVEQKVRLQAERIFRLNSPKEASPKGRPLSLPPPDGLLDEKTAKVHREVQERLNALKETIRSRTILTRGTTSR